ncbi:MAG TPA: S1 family peptidase [Thermoanaerobaculia bacterium]|jgi:hypothetical protein
MRLFRLLALGLLIFAALSGMAFAQGPSDAASYAADWGVSLDEATYRLSLQVPIGEFDANLTEVDRGSFAGLWIEHAPAFRVVVRSTDPNAGQQISSMVAGTVLEGLVTVESAGFSLEELEAAQASSHSFARKVGEVVESEINVQTNWVELYSLNPKQLLGKLAAAGLKLPPSVVVFAVARLSVPDVNIYGGLALRTCTSGFSVQDNNRTRGITTAAHCSNNQTFGGQALTFQAELQSGDQDVQWHTAPGLTVTNQFDSGIGVRACTATLGRNNQAVGDYVCKNGMTTGYTCGNISSTTYAPGYVTNANPTFIRVHNNAGTPLRAGGDSGGPWFLVNTAYGTHSGSPGADPNDALYMAINYVSALNVTVLTGP